MQEDFSERVEMEEKEEMEERVEMEEKEKEENNIVIEDIILFKMRAVKISVISLITICLFITIAIIILQILS